MSDNKFLRSLLVLGLSITAGVVNELKAAEGSFDVFGAETMPAGAIQYYVNNRITTRETVVNGSNLTASE